MKICILVDDYLPQSTKVAGKMMHDLAKEFVLSGHSVTVVTPSISQSKTEVTLSLEEVIDGVKISRFNSGKIKNISKLRRLVNEMLLSYRAWSFLKKKFKEDHHDLIIYYSPTIFWFPLVNKLKSIWSSKSFLILRDFFPQWAIDSGLLRERSLITLFLQYCERKNYEIANSIGIQSPANLKWYSEKYPKYKDRTHLLYNWAENIRTKSSESNYRKLWNIGERVIFFYGGNIGHAQDMKNLIVLADGMKHNKDAFFLFVGSGDETELIKKNIKDRNLQNCQIHDPIPQVEFLKLLNEIDVGLFSLNPKHITHNFPGKILGYMQLAKPILGALNQGNDLFELLMTSDSGLVSIAGDHEQLLENANRLMARDLRKRMGVNSKKLLDSTFSPKAACNVILSSVTN